MAPLRKLIPVLIAGAASLAFVGVAAALEGGDDTSTTTTTTEVVESTTTTEVTTTTTEVTETPDPADDPADTTTTDGVHPDNHGAAVSQAAHDCPPGPDHGACVREVAQSDAGKAGNADDQLEADDQAQNDQDQADDSAGDDGEGAGTTGAEHSQGHGHQDGSGD